jgi:hypothetical protein
LAGIKDLLATGVVLEAKMSRIVAA